MSGFLIQHLHITSPQINLVFTLLRSTKDMTLSFLEMVKHLNPTHSSHDLVNMCKIYQIKFSIWRIWFTPLLFLNHTTIGLPLGDTFEYRSIVGALQYVLLTQPDIMFVVNKAYQFLHCPTDKCWKVVKRIIWYLSESMDISLFFTPSSL